MCGGWCLGRIRALLNEQTVTRGGMHMQTIKPNKMEQEKNKKENEIKNKKEKKRNTNTRNTSKKKTNHGKQIYRGTHLAFLIQTHKFYIEKSKTCSVNETFPTKTPLTHDVPNLQRTKQQMITCSVLFLSFFLFFFFGLFVCFYCFVSLQPLSFFSGFPYLSSL